MLLTVENYLARKSEKHIRSEKSCSTKRCDEFFDYADIVPHVLLHECIDRRHEKEASDALSCILAISMEDLPAIDDTV